MKEARIRAYSSIYTRINWANLPSTDTPVNETNLNNMDYAIKVHDTRICELDSKKAENSQLLSLISNWELDEITGIITITRYDGSKILFDLNIEKLPVAFELSSDGILTMTTDDGTAFEANIGDMIPVLQFEDSDTISVSVSGEGKNKTYTFSVRKGSITDEMLESGYLANVTVQAENAKMYSENAYQSQNNAAYEAELARSYAVGGSGVRDGENTDNAKYYKEQVKAMHGDYTKGQVIGVKGNNETTYRTGNVNLTADNIGATTHIDLTGQLQTVNYRKSVIALCKTSVANTDINSYSSGTLTYQRNNGSINHISKVNILINGDYTLENGINVNILSSTNKVTPCTFSYNGVIYGGVEVYFNDACSQTITFDGTTNFDIFGLDYYDTQNKVALNEEVYNSLNYDNVTWLDNNTLNGEQIATEGDITEATSKIQTTSTVTIPTTSVGWYRVAELVAAPWSEVRSIVSECTLSLKRMGTGGETCVLKFISNYNSASLYAIDVKSINHLITKARFVHDVPNSTSYLEIYYDTVSSNTIHVKVSDAIRTSGSVWRAITPTLTAEVVDGVTVATIYDIPANLTPASDLDLAEVKRGLLEVNDLLKVKANEYESTIDLTDISKYNEDTWYPCVGSSIIPSRTGGGLHSIQLVTYLGWSGIPSWATHSNGFSCNMDLLVKSNGWGATDGASLCFDYSWKNTSKAPCSYSQMTNSSKPVLWLRGGGKYYVYTDYNTAWIPQTTAFTASSQTVQPTTTVPELNPGTQATIHANLNGKASTATTLDGLTASVDELNCVKGVISNVQDQFNVRPKVAFFEETYLIHVKGDISDPITSFTNRIADFNELVGVIVTPGTDFQSTVAELKYRGEGFQQIYIHDNSNEDGDYEAHVNVAIFYK